MPRPVPFAVLILAASVLALLPAGGSRAVSATLQVSSASEQTQSAIPGDVDCNGVVDSIDALQVLRSVASLPAADCLARAGDVDCDAQVNPIDALRILRFVAGLVGPLPVCNQPLWYLTRGAANTDAGWGVDVDPLGDVYFATHQADPGPWTDMIIYKFAPDGTELWKTRWGGPWGEQAFVVTVRDGVAYIGGFTQHGPAFPADADMAVVALSTADGHLLWDFTWDQGYGYEEVDGLVVNEGYLYVAGWTTGQTTSNDVALLKLDLGGHLVSSKTWGSSGWDEENGQIVVDSQRVYLAGRYNAANALFGGDAFVAAFSKETGDFIDKATWGGLLVEDALGMTSDGDHLYVVGVTGNHGNGGQIFLRKYNKDLSLVWEALWGGAGSESARVAAVDGRGVLVAGWTNSSGQGHDDLALLRFSANGDLSWSRTWGGPGFDEAHGLVIDGPVAYIAGETTSFGAGKQDALLAKINALTGDFPPQ